MAKNRAVYLAALLCAAGMYIESGSRALLLTTLVLAGAALLSGAALAMSAPRTRITARLRAENGTVGHPLRLELGMMCGALLPGGTVQVKYSCVNRLYGERHGGSLCLQPGGDAAQYAAALPSAECGAITVQFECAVRRDLLGLWAWRVAVPQPLQFTAYPEIPSLEIALRETAAAEQQGSSYDPSHRGNDVTEVFALRDYQPGDTLNSIHWKLSGKVGRLVVREFSDPINEQVCLFCDCAFSGYAEAHALVNSVYGMTAAVSRSLVRGGIGHRVCAVRGSELSIHTVETPDAVLQTLTELLHLQLSAQAAALTPLLQHAAAARLVVITARLREEMLSELAQDTQLTVILVTDGGQEHVEHRQGYTLLALPAQRLGAPIHLLEI